jgi:uncharacterized membrane protein YbhN (UPF0104 family)
VLTLAGTAAVVGVLAWVLADQRAEFTRALEMAPLWILALAAVLQIVALLSRSEAWHQCVQAAGGTVGRRMLFRAASLGNLGSLLNSQFGAAARIAVLRRSAPQQCPRIGPLITAEVPIITVEAILAALTCFTLVEPLGLPWWSPIIALAAVALAVLGLGRLANRRREGFWSGLAILRSLDGRNRVVLLVLVAVFAQIARNWIVLRALGVDASFFDAIAVLITMVVISALPVGPSVGAAAVVVILGADGVALAAGAGVLLTATGTVGALCFLAWGGVDRLFHHQAVAHRVLGDHPGLDEVHQVVRPAGLRAGA